MFVQGKGCSFVPGDILVQSMEESFDFLQLAPVDEVGWGEQGEQGEQLGTG